VCAGVEPGRVGMEARQARSDRPSWRDESRRPQSQGAVRPPSAAKASTSGAELLPGPEPALHHRLNSPLTYFRLGKCCLVEDDMHAPSGGMTSRQAVPSSGSASLTARNPERPN